LLGELQHHFAVTAIDLPGFGRSSKDPASTYGLDEQAERVAKALTQLQIGKCGIVGSSMGGAIALWLAKSFPERFKKVAVLAPAVDPSLVSPWIRNLRGTIPLVRRALNRFTMKRILAKIAAHQELINPGSVSAYLEPYLDRGDAAQVFWLALGALTDSRLPDQLKGLPADVLLLYGERDLVVPDSAIQKLKAILPRTQIVRHPDAGHHLMEDEPQWCARVLQDFFLARPSESSS
jgi:pimeloyl-ACP methyl ester carboxylesterase